MNKKPVIMISAMYENGGNTTQRLLDGHPDLFVYPFESQLGTKYVLDGYSSMYPQKYRWPEWLMGMKAADIYDTIIDEECRIRTKTTFVSKFRDADLELDEKVRKHKFVAQLEHVELTRKNVVLAYLQATHESWTNYYAKQVKGYVGYSPVVAVDAQKMVADNVYVIQVVRNPFSAYADTKKRAVPMSLDSYVMAWINCQLRAKIAMRMAPNQVFMVRFEDIIVNPVKVLTSVLHKIGFESSQTLAYPSWNGKKLDQVYPWGTIRIPTPAVNIATANELTNEEKEEIRVRMGEHLGAFGYQEFG